MKEQFKYGIQLGNKARDGIRVRIIVEKETPDLSATKPMTVEEVEQFLREIGKYLAVQARFETLTRIK